MHTFIQESDGTFAVIDPTGKVVLDKMNISGAKALCESLNKKLPPKTNEYWIEAPESIREKCRAICGENDVDSENEDVFIYRRIEIDTATDMAYQAGLKQNLQKAREQAYKDGARDVQDFAIAEIMKRAGQLRDDITFFAYEKIQSELDQPNK